MSDERLRLRLLGLIVFGSLSLVVWLLPAAVTTSPAYLSVHFLDVGQGDAILVETPDGVQVLIDGGPNGAVIKALSQKLRLTDRDLDLVVATHSDSDHIGGLIDVLKRYQVKALLITENTGDSKAAKTYDDLVEKEGAEIVYARSGQVWQLGASTTMEVLWPESDPSELESNAASIIVKVNYGDTAFVLTGDAPKRIEEYLALQSGEQLQANVLKAGHHGSRTSTAELFLETVDPDYVVLSYGENNRYGHPHVEVTDLLFNQGVKMYSTAEEGTVTFYSDGETVWVR